MLFFVKVLNTHNYNYSLQSVLAHADVFQMCLLVDYMSIFLRKYMYYQKKDNVNTRIQYNWYEFWILKKNFNHNKS